MLIDRRNLLGCAALAGMMSRSIAAQDIVSEAIVQVENALRARLGVWIKDHESGRLWRYRQDERFPMTSTFKAPAAGALLAKVDRGETRLDQTVEVSKDDIVTYAPAMEKAVGQRVSLAAICEAAVTLSDNTAGNLQLRALGGPEGFTQFLRSSLGDDISRLDRWETDLNEALAGDPRDTTTPAALGRNIETLILGEVLSLASRAQLRQWLLANTTGNAKVRAGLPPGWQVGDKTGAGGFGTNNDTGFILPPGRKPIIFAIMMTQTEAPVAERNAGMATIAKALAKALAA